jgi:hypothetical protein
MDKITISKPHSSVDLITNSSTVIFTVSNSYVNMIQDLIRHRCQTSDDMEWFDKWLTVIENEDGNIEIESFINDPDWFCDFINDNFNVINEWFS